MANSTFKFLTKHFLVFDSLGVNDINFGLFGSSRGKATFIGEIFRDHGEIDAGIIVYVDQSISSNTTLSLIPSCNGTNTAR